MFPIASRVVMVLVLAALSGPGCGQSAVAQDKDTDQIAFLGVLLKRLASPWTYTVLYERNQISIDGCGPGSALESIASEIAKPSSGSATEPGSVYSVAVAHALSLPGPLAFHGRYRVTQVGGSVLSEPIDSAQPAILKAPIGHLIKYADNKQVVVHPTSPLAIQSIRDIMCPLDTAPLALATYAQHWKTCPDGYVIMDFDSMSRMTVAVSESKSYMRATMESGGAVIQMHCWLEGATYSEGLAGCLVPRLVVCTKKSADAIVVNRFTLSDWKLPTEPIMRIACDKSYYIIDRRYHQFWSGAAGSKTVPTDIARFLKIETEAR